MSYDCLFTFIDNQVGGPDVASEETIETSMIIEIPQNVTSEAKVISSHLSSDHCYTFKKGIRPRDLDRVKTKAAMLGETGDIQSISQPYAFILPKQIAAPVKTSPPKTLLETKKPEIRRAYRETKCGKHRWLWQFMKELLFIGDPCIKWYNQKEGSFMLPDQDQLAIKWECYKKINQMKAQVTR